MVTGIVLAAGVQYCLAGHTAAAFMGVAERKRHGLVGKQAILVQTGVKTTKWGYDPDFAPIKDFQRGAVRVLNWKCTSVFDCKEAVVPTTHAWSNGMCFVRPARGYTFSQYVWVVDAQGAVIDASTEEFPWGMISLIVPGKRNSLHIFPVGP